MRDYVKSKIHDLDNPNWATGTLRLPEVYEVLKTTDKIIAEYYESHAEVDLREVVEELGRREQLPMGRRQRIHLYLNLATLRMYMENYEQGLEAIDKGLEIAKQASATHPVEDVLAELYQIRSRLNSAMLRLADATSDLAVSIRYQEAHLWRTGEDYPRARLLALSDKATWEYFLGRLDAVRKTLAKANSIANNLPLEGNEMAKANLMWMEARLLRLQEQDQISETDRNRRLRQAVARMEDAAELYAVVANMISRGRILRDTAETLLDCVRSTAEGIERDEMLRRAYQYAKMSLTFANREMDRAGYALALLTEARVAELIHSGDDALILIDEALQIGENLNDEALKAQAFIVQGDEFLARGERERAHDCWLQVVQMLAGSELRIFQTIAMRKLVMLVTSSQGE